MHGLALFLCAGSCDSRRHRRFRPFCRSNAMLIGFVDHKTLVVTPALLDGGPEEGQGDGGDGDEEMAPSYEKTACLTCGRQTPKCRLFLAGTYKPSGQYGLCPKRVVTFCAQACDDKIWVPTIPDTCGYMRFTLKSSEEHTKTSRQPPSCPLVTTMQRRSMLALICRTPNLTVVMLQDFPRVISYSPERLRLLSVAPARQKSIRNF